MMDEQNKDAEIQTRKHPLPPIKLFQQVFCRHCDLQCSPTETRFQNCTLPHCRRTRQTTPTHTTKNTTPKLVNTVMETTASAIGSCDTSCFQQNSGFFRRNSHAERSVQPSRNVSHPSIEAEGVAYHA